MATKRITMRKIREVLRHTFYAAQLSVRKISASTKVSVGAIQKLLTKAKSVIVNPGHYLMKWMIPS